MKTQDKIRLTKAEHEKINQAKDTNFYNDIMIKLEENNTITKAEHEKINQENNEKKKIILDAIEGLTLENKIIFLQKLLTELNKNDGLRKPNMRK